MVPEEHQSDHLSGSEKSWLQFWTPGEERLPGGPKEWSEALLEIRHKEVKLGETDWTAFQLLRNGSPMALRREQVGGRVRTVAPWPRSGPGHYELRLRGPGTKREARISIWPKKITREEYERLLGDLESELPVQIAVALQGAGGLAGVELARQEGTTLAQEMVRLRRAVEGTGQRIGLARVLKELAGQPHRVLTSEERWVRSGRARRPPGHRLGQAFARPGNIEEGELNEVPDTRTRHTTDVYENRLLRQFERQVRFRLRRVEVLLEEKEDRAARETSRLLEKLQSARRQATFLSDVSGLKRPPTRASQVLQKRPLYRAALKGYLEFQREIGVSLDAPEIEAPLENLPFLYQLWCTLRLIRAVVTEAKQRGFRVRRSELFRREAGFLTLSLGGRAAWMQHPETQAEMSIYTERTYSRNGSGLLRSVSYSQRPDIAIEATLPSGEKTVFLFDPKYKLDGERAKLSSSPEDSSPWELDPESETSGRAKKPDIDKMHTYRDAIRDADGNRVVRYAAIFYPGQTETFSEGLEAISVRPGDTSLLRQVVASRLEEAFR
jgi:hypothetical protein